MAFGKKLRNRIIGFLVIVSLVMILLPMMMKPEDTYRKSDSSIAVDQNGALTDGSGRMAGGGQDYSDLLAPVEDVAVDPQEVARNNAQSGARPGPDEGSPFAAERDRAIPSDPQAQVEQLKSAQQTPVQNTASQNQSAVQGNSETLTSSRKPQPQAQPKPQAKPEKRDSKETLVSSRQPKPQSQAVSGKGGYAVQVGVFSQQANADKVIAKLRAAGISCRSVIMELSGRKAVKVLAGSASSREAAASIAARVQQITGTKANVVEL
ncbi:MAG: SPOR domain-containing protein [Succinivibrio sp.]|nr:SPOR domain-containing protein [Succinivibrio sp.]